ncbi:hypothetical protein LTS72_19870 [Mycobacterium ostraviense]|nr:hypothetical protein [Mycobacterium ostraviense]UGT90532.1 hypothetical protein LTS72_19870 [Mycobacterium ostraviense]
MTAGFLTLFGFIFVITQYFQFIKDYRALETGVRLLRRPSRSRWPASWGRGCSSGSAPPPSSSPV